MLLPCRELKRSTFFCLTKAAKVPSGYSLVKGSADVITNMARRVCPDCKHPLARHNLKSGY